MSETKVKATEVRPRKFVFNGMQLADPDPKMTPQKVAEFHSLLHAELTNVTVKGPTKTTDSMNTNSFRKSELSDEEKELSTRKQGMSVPALFAGTEEEKRTQSG